MEIVLPASCFPIHAQCRSVDPDFFPIGGGWDITLFAKP